MKKYLLFCAALVFAFNINSAKAQIISSQADGMEVWADDPANSSVKDPDAGTLSTPGWQCLNLFTSLLLGHSPQSVFKDSATVFSGSYSCKIQSVVLSATSYAYISSGYKHDTLAAILTGTLVSSPSFKIVPGVPYTTRTSAINFEYQYAPQMNNAKPDTGYCAVVLSKAHVQIGAGYVRLNSAASWTAGSCPITYVMAGNPDSITVVFSSSSQYKPAPGSILLIDAVTAAAPLDVNELSNNAEITVYPNPASWQINFSVNGTNAHFIKVYDITGKEVNTYTAKDNLLSINTSTYANGLYIYQALDVNGGLIKVGKFNISK